MSKKRKRSSGSKKNPKKTGQRRHSKQTSTPDLQKALRLHQSGHMREAEIVYRQIIQADHQQVQANHLLGVLYYQTRRFDLAIACYQKTVQLQPDFVDAYGNLGIALKAVGRLDQAIISFKKALAIDPGLGVVHNNLGNALRELGHTDAAVTSYQQALERDPEFAECHNNLGNALADLGRLDEAVNSFKKAIALKPNLIEAYNNLGNALKASQRLSDAVVFYQQALAIKPDYFEAHNNLGNGLSDLNRMDEAIVSYKKALQINPGYVEAHNSLGLALKDLGRMDQAIASFEKAIAIQPDYAKAHANLSQMRKHTDGDGDGEVRAMAELYDRSDLPDDQRIHLAFGLARAYENLGQYGRAFECLSDGQRLQKVAVPFDLAKATRFFKLIEDMFDPNFLAKQAKSGFEDESPIFVLGMPRSGSSLVEQILASHPQVYGAGELKAVGELTRRMEKSAGESFPKAMGSVDPNIFHELGASYIEMVRRLAPRIKFITDKMPANFLCIGFIATMLPRARFIHCLRDPMDTCFSIYKSQFSESHDYSHNLASLGGYYLLYEELMAHWHRVLPDRIFDIRYEQLVQNSETEIRSMLDYCDLPFDKACLSFYKTDRVVKTASATQVRQPIYQNAIGFWKNYEDQLTPLQSALKRGLPWLNSKENSPPSGMG